jgi:hypothetical protein
LIWTAHCAAWNFWEFLVNFRDQKSGAVVSLRPVAILSARGFKGKDQIECPPGDTLHDMTPNAASSLQIVLGGLRGPCCSIMPPANHVPMYTGRTFFDYIFCAFLRIL